MEQSELAELRKAEDAYQKLVQLHDTASDPFPVPKKENRQILYLAGERYRNNFTLQEELKGPFIPIFPRKNPS